MNAFPLHEHTWVENLGEEAYRIRQPLPIRIKRMGAANFEASFRKANIAISGTDRDNAFRAIVAEILDTFDTLVKEII